MGQLKKIGHKLSQTPKAVDSSPVWDLQDEVGREMIHEWSQKRIFKLSTKGNFFSRCFLLYTFKIVTLKSFFQNFNFMVFVQMALAGIAVYLSTHFNLTFDVNINLFVSPIVFPLAFAINADFQRREKVLDDLANFKAAAMTLFFCMRDWREPAQLDKLWMQAFHQKLKVMLFYMREYLMTNKIVRRKVILRAIYEDLSDINQLIENVRVSQLPTNTSLIARALVLMNTMGLAFERLRVVREYRSPRSIRSFNKVLIFFLPTILSPNFVFIGHKSGNVWASYYISILVAFVFSALQGVQDKLDDPFDGMSEDDINLSTIDEWTFQSLGATVNRTFTVGRFKVETQASVKDNLFPRSRTSFTTVVDTNDGLFLNRKKSLRRVSSSDESTLGKMSGFILNDHPSLKNWILKKKSQLQFEKDVVLESFDPQSHPYAGILDKIQGNTTILPGGIIKQPVEDPAEDSITNRDSYTNRVETSGTIATMLAHKTNSAVSQSTHVLPLSSESQDTQPQGSESLNTSHTFMSSQKLFSNPNLWLLSGNNFKFKGKHKKIASEQVHLLDNDFISNNHCEKIVDVLDNDLKNQEPLDSESDDDDDDSVFAEI
ncbi:uncharacterized protein LOC100203174 isoform X1 [Hydra vulgaris]|uniref:uncharacterized protein LOC100203174 isoform X1 n=1 Tax=Hydra vulgaris TaxID=6087 RepID=UPI0002B47DDB|nr:uncharacterized protein LOC100203174 [Hydra vulgaris]